MADVVQNHRLSVVLPASILATLMLCIISLALGLAYGSHWAYVSALFFAAVCFMLLATLLENLWRRWQRDGYPPVVGWSLAACWGVFAALVWAPWELATGHDRHKRIVAFFGLWYGLCLVLFVPLGFSAAHPAFAQLAGGWAWLVLIAAEIFFLYGYLNATWAYLITSD